MTYIDYLNEFNRWIENNHLTLPAQVLYFRLLNVFNRAGWPEWVPVDTIRLQVDKWIVKAIRLQSEGRACKGWIYPIPAREKRGPEPLFPIGTIKFWY